VTHAGYVAAGYVIVFVTLAAYAAWTLVRGWRLSRRVAPEDRRWL
jgi:hypothetical protein